MQHPDIKTFGELKASGYVSKSVKQEVRDNLIKAIQEKKETFNGVLGSRMMGGGFGGCTINIVLKSKVDVFADTLKEAYLKNFHHEMKSYVVSLKNGTSTIDSDAFSNSIG